MNKIELMVSQEPDVAGSHACRISLRVEGNVHECSMLLAAVMAQNPRLVPIVVEALMNLDNVKPVRIFTNN